MLLALLHHGCIFASIEESKIDNADTFLLGKTPTFVLVFRLTAKVCIAGVRVGL